MCENKNYCESLRKRISSSRSKGIVIVHLSDEQGNEDSAIVYKTRADERGILLNFCPFCGQRLNEELVKNAIPIK